MRWFNLTSFKVWVWFHRVTETNWGQWEALRCTTHFFTHSDHNMRLCDSAASWKKLGPVLLCTKCTFHTCGWKKGAVTSVSIFMRLFWVTRHQQPRVALMCPQGTEAAQLSTGWFLVNCRQAKHWSHIHAGSVWRFNVWSGGRITRHVCEQYCRNIVTQISWKLWTATSGWDCPVLFVGTVGVTAAAKAEI